MQDETVKSTLENEFFNKYRYILRVFSLRNDILFFDLKNNLNNADLLNLIERSIKKLELENGFFIESPPVEFWKEFKESFDSLIELRDLGQLLEVTQLIRSNESPLDSIALLSILKLAKLKLESLLILGFQRSELLKDQKDQEPEK